MTATARPASAHASARGRLGPLIARGAAILAALAAIHLSVLAGREGLAVAVLLWGVAALCGLTALTTRGRRALIPAGAALLLAAAGVLQAVAPSLDPRIALVLPPTLGNLTVSGVFAYTLLPGHEPAIVRVARVSRGEVPPDLAAYARGVTRLWAIMPAVVAAVALSALALWGTAAWSWIANVANPLLLAGAFVGEHWLRGRRFPRYGPASLRHTLSVMLDKRAWPLPQGNHG